MDAKCKALEKRQNIKRWINCAVIFILTLAVFTEVCVRLVVDYMYALLVVNIELFILGVGLSVTTLIYVRMQTRVFQGDFAKEQKFFIWSMASLLIVYIMRFANMMAIDMWQDQYLAWMRKYPASFVTTTAVFHIFYDAFPVVHIMLRHPAWGA